MNIFLDLDGVIFSAEKSMCKLFNSDLSHENWPDQDWRVFKVLGITKDEFWKEVDKGGWEFWAEIEKYSWTDELIELIKEFDRNFHILTAPTRNPECSKGKIIAIQKLLGWDFRNHIVAPSGAKRFCAAPGRILIDDRISNVQDWNSHSGYGLLFPQPWNMNKDQIPENRVDYIREKLLYLREEGLNKAKRTAILQG